MNTLFQLGLPTEGAVTNAVMLITPGALAELLQDKRRSELVEPLKISLLKLTSQESARLMSRGMYEESLPLALEALEQSQALFKGNALELLPIYLLAAQANLGLGKDNACEDLLGLASHLSNSKEARDLCSPLLLSQMNRLWGQLYTSRGRYIEALKAFAEDVYYSSQSHGPTDLRTSLGFYNLSKTFYALGDTTRSLSNQDQAVTILVDAMRANVSLEMNPSSSSSSPSSLRTGKLVGGGEKSVEGGGGGSDAPSLDLNAHQMMELVLMIQDIMETQAKLQGPDHPRAGDLLFVLGLCYLHMGKMEEAKKALMSAGEMFKQIGEEAPLRIVESALKLTAQA